jgi:hypothetical protein
MIVAQNHSKSSSKAKHGGMTDKHFWLQTLPTPPRLHHRLAETTVVSIATKARRDTIVQQKTAKGTKAVRCADTKESSKAAIGVVVGT